MAVLKSVLVLGPTGGFGQFLIAELVKRSADFSRVAAFNDTSRPQIPSRLAVLSSYQKQGVEIVRASFEDVDAYKGFDVVVMCLGNHAMYRQPLVIQTAIKAGVRHFYPSEFGADLTVPGNWEERYYRDKVITRELLQKMSNEIPGLGYTLFVVGRFTEWAPLPHFRIYTTQRKALITGRAEMKQSLLGARDAASYLIATLLDPLPGIAERTYRISGGDYSWTEIFAALEAVQGGPKYKVTYLDVEEARERQKKAIENGDVDKELEASHQVIQGSGRTILPEPHDNWRFPDIRPEAIEVSFRRMFEEREKFPLLEPL